MYISQSGYMFGICSTFAFAPWQHILKDVHYIDMFILDIEGGELEDWIGT
jgi:myosin-crossreactive antigen